LNVSGELRDKDMEHGPTTSDEPISILVVDDLEEKLLVYRSILDELGQHVVTARSGEEALKHVLKTEFAVILLDVQMPGIDGFETASLIRKRRRSMHTPIIFLTAFIDDLRTATGYAHGAVDYISTPVVPEILRAKVRVFVDLYQMTQQVRRQAEAKVALALERSRREAVEVANHRLVLLARAGAILGQSLDYMVTATDVTRLAVPALADHAVVAVRRPGESTWTAVSARRDRDGSVTIEDGRSSVSIRSTQIIEAVLAEERFKPDSQEMILPLRARGTPFGAMILVRHTRQFEDPDVTVAEALAGRAGIAIENARLYQGIETADRQKNEFLSMLAHELRNPLAPIVNAAEILRLSMPDQPQVQWARSVIDRQLNHLVRLVDDLLDVSRITSGKIRLQKAPVNMTDVLSSAVEASRPLIDRAGHQFEEIIATEPIWVFGDAARLTQVVTNLLRNAAKYTDPGGRVSLRLSLENETAVIRVRDTGIGIPPDMLSSIFDLFTQIDRSLDRSQGGLGIGLTLVRRLVHKHGGSVSASSDGPGKGSEFVVRLPTIPSPDERERSQIRQDGDLARNRLCALVVDDHVDSGGSLAMLLRTMCRDVHVAHHGVAGILLAREQLPDVVFLDIGLPGMNGYEVARQLRAMPETEHAVLIALTGYSRAEDQQRSIEAGFDRHLVKPIDSLALRQSLESLAPRSPSRPSPS
jgi:signal transduction histidine kinase